MKNKYAFSLMELIVVVIVLSILVGLFIPVFLKTIERFKDKEATTGLRLIRQAEKIYQYEIGSYYPEYGSQDNVTIINSNLKIDLKENDWDYKIIAPMPDIPGDYSAQATRTTGRCRGRVWRIYFIYPPPLDEPKCQRRGDIPDWCCPPTGKD